MKRKFKWTMIVVLGAIATLFLLTGCKFSRTVEEIRTENGLDVEITYYANGGVINGKDTDKTLYMQKGDKAFNLGVSGTESGSLSISRENYTFEGWYFAELDNEGKVQYDENGNILLGEAVDFSVAMQKDWVIAAKWSANVKVKVLLACDAGENVVYDYGTTETGDDITYQNGDELFFSLPYESNGKVSEVTMAPFTPKDRTHTFVEYCQLAQDGQTLEPLDWTTLQEGTEDQVIYAKYVTGNYIMLRTAKDVRDSLFYYGMDEERFYLVNDIDCASITVRPLTEFRATLEGNGYTISNLTVKLTQIARGDVAIFGDIKEMAVMKDVTFENVQVEFQTKSQQAVDHANVFFVFTSCASTNIVNVTVDGDMKVTCSNTVKLDNLLVDPDAATPTYKTDNWKFGGTYGDVNYQGGFTVTDESTLTVNGQLITTNE